MALPLVDVDAEVVQYSDFFCEIGSLRIVIGLRGVDEDMEKILARRWICQQWRDVAYNQIVIVSEQFSQRSPTRKYREKGGTQQ